jgi:hypothetical protein
MVGIGWLEILLLIVLVTGLIVMQIIRWNRRVAEKPPDSDDDQAW